MRPVSSGAVDFIDVRETNLAVVLRFIRREAPCSRAEVAAGTGLNKATISNIVAELITRGIVVEVGASEERRIGRPAVMLTLDGRRFTALGLEVNVDYLSAVMVDLAERDVLTWHEPVQAAELGAEGCVVRLADLARRAMGEMARQHREVLGITIAVPGLIGTSDGEVAEAPNLGWHEFPLVDRFREQLDDSSVALSLDNDANLGAVGEYRRGAMAHTQNLVYLTGEVGVGGGVIINGALMRGSSGYGGEVGHITLMQDGPLCGCGRRGCFEALVGIGSIIQQAAPDLAGSTAQPLTDLAAKVAEVARRAEAGDPRTTAALVRVGEWLGRGSAILLNLFNPQALILGGYFVTLAPWIMPPARRTLAAHTIAPNLGGCQVALSTLGFTAAARGGASSIIDAIDTARLPLPRGGSAAHR